MLRFYDPDSGRVLIDGRDARDYPLRRLREQMAIVPQDVVLFGGSIADNIAYGRPGASPAEIEVAAHRRPTRTISSPPFPPATRPSSANGASSCPAVSDNG